MSQTNLHKLAHGTLVDVHPEEIELPPRGEILALLPEICEKHHAPRYGCVHNDVHFSVCEAHIEPTPKRKMN